MKARIKATGEIIEVYFYGKEGYDYVCNDKDEVYERGELEIIDEPDYWARLEHQAAIAAMQGLMSNIKQITPTMGHSYRDEIIGISLEVARTLVEKMKEERK